MPKEFTLGGPIIKPRNGAKIESAVIFLHGLGSDGANMIDIGGVLQADLPNSIFIAPNAPFDLDMAPKGMGYQWFSLSSWSPKSMLDGANKAAPILNKFIDKILAEYNLPPEKLALVGFSQGTMMAIHTALRRTDKLGAVVGFSGALIAPELLAAEIRSRPDICLIHGALDMVVPYAALHMAETALSLNGLKTTTHTSPYLDHSIDMPGINVAKNFLKERLI